MNNLDGINISVAFVLKLAAMAVININAFVRVESIMLLLVHELV